MTVTAHLQYMQILIFFLKGPGSSINITHAYIIIYITNRTLLPELKLYIESLDRKKFKVKEISTFLHLGTYKLLVGITLSKYTLNDIKSSFVSEYFIYRNKKYIFLKDNNCVEMSIFIYITRRWPQEQDSHKLNGSVERM